MSDEKEIIKVDFEIKEIQCPECKETIPKLHSINYCPLCDIEW